MHLAGCLTDVHGLLVGHWTHPDIATGCTVVLCPPGGAMAAVDVRGAAPGTRETDLLLPGNLVEKIHALTFSGGSAWGLDTASGVMRWLESQGRGFPAGDDAQGRPIRVPIVPGAVIFDLAYSCNPGIRPDAASGFAACLAARAEPCAQGRVGAGAGARVGKLWGLGLSMPGGLGCASVQIGQWIVSAMIVCNAVGDIFDPDTGQRLAGAQLAQGQYSEQAMLNHLSPTVACAGANTTIGLIATNAPLTRTQLKRLAVAGHTGLAATIRPSHTLLDGDTLFALSTSDSLSQQTLPQLLSLEVASAFVVKTAIKNIYSK